MARLLLYICNETKTNIIMDAQVNESVKITSLEQLKSLFTGEHDCDTGEFFVGTIFRSWKLISFDGDDTFFITNEIDDTEQELTSEELFDDSKTNIGKAMREGVFFFAWF